MHLQVFIGWPLNVYFMFVGSLHGIESACVFAAPGACWLGGWVYCVQGCEFFMEPLWLWGCAGDRAFWVVCVLGTLVVVCLFWGCFCAVALCFGCCGLQAGCVGVTPLANLLQYLPFGVSNLRVLFSAYLPVFRGVPDVRSF